jgi:acyl carrier protein
MQERILRIIYEVIDGINESHLQSKKIPHQSDAKLYGDGAVLDSLALITLIVEVEERVQTVFSTSITLADDRALTRTISPFSTVKNLADYVEILINESK